MIWSDGSVIRRAVIIVHAFVMGTLRRPIGIIEMQCRGSLELCACKVDPIDMQARIVGKLLPRDGMDPRADPEKSAEREDHVSDLPGVLVDHERMNSAKLLVARIHPRRAFDACRPDQRMGIVDRSVDVGGNLTNGSVMTHSVESMLVRTLLFDQDLRRVTAARGEPLSVIELFNDIERQDHYYSDTQERFCWVVM